MVIVLFITCCLTQVLANPVLNFPRLPLSYFEDGPDAKPDIKGLLSLTKDLQKPTNNEKNIPTLLFQLGKEYDPEYTSIVEPDALKAYEPSIITASDHIHSHLKNHPEMPEDLKHMKFIIKKTNGKRRELGKRSSEKFQKWLWNLSRCPVRYRWLDLGENIFPRYIKRGTCSKKKTCSFPAGMKCKKSEWKPVTVLIYTCMKQYASSCKWTPLILHVLTKCSCGCQK